MGPFLAWVVVGVLIGWGFKSLFPGERGPLSTALLFGIMGALLGGLLASSYSRTQGLGSSAMAALMGAIVASLALLFYQVRRAS